MVLEDKIISEKIEHLAQCGGKGRNLVILLEGGFQVPKFTMLLPDNIRKLFPLSAQEIDAYYNGISASKQNELLILWEAFKDRIEKVINEIAYKELLVSVQSVFGDSYSISVRSSVSSEDGAQASFAGLFHSELEVDSSTLKTALVDCYASLFHPNVIEYSALQGLNPRDNTISLVLQKMVFAYASGVIFTMNPQGNFDDVLISTALGSGEGVVNNTAEVSNYLYNRRSVQWQQISGEEKILTEQNLKELYETALSIEKQMGNPQDIEFSYDANGKLWILQSRPITTIDITKLRILDNSNIVESYPGITLPLSFSFARNGYQQVFTSAAYLFKIPHSKVLTISDELSQMIRHVNGRVYYNLHNWYKLVQLVIASNNSLQAWENLIGIKSNGSNANVYSYLLKMKSALISVFLFFRYPKIVREFYQKFEVDYGELRSYTDSIEDNKPSGKEVFEFYKQISDKLFSKWSATLLNDFFTFKFYDFLVKQCSKYSDEKTLANDLLCGLPDVESELLVKELLKLKELILSDQELKKLFEEDAELILGKIPPSLQFKIDVFVHRFGDRTLEELKLESPNYRMNPLGFIQLLKSQLQNINSVESLSNKQEEIRTQAEQYIFVKQKKYSVRTWVFKMILKMARTSIRNRENMRIRRTRSYGAVKELFTYIGREMQAKGVLLASEDVHYITIEELESYCNGEDVHYLQKEVVNRKAQYAEYELMQLPDRMVFNGDVPPVVKTAYSFDLEANKWSGDSISKGIVKAECVVLTKPDINADVEGKILITRMTDPAWVFLMTRASGLISEKGSPLSHTAIVGRELGIPVLIGVKNATQLIESGSLLELNCDEGYVEKLTT